MLSLLLFIPARSSRLTRLRLNNRKRPQTYQQLRFCHRATIPLLDSSPPVKLCYKSRQKYGAICLKVFKESSATHNQQGLWARKFKTKNSILKLSCLYLKSIFCPICLQATAACFKTFRRKMLSKFRWNNKEQRELFEPETQLATLVIRIKVNTLSNKVTIIRLQMEF